MCRLQYPNVPCLNVGTPRKVIFIPAEVCKVAAGQRRLKLDEHQTAEMIKTSAQVQQPYLPSSSMFPALPISASSLKPVFRPKVAGSLDLDSAAAILMHAAGVT